MTAERSARLHFGPDPQGISAGARWNHWTWTAMVWAIAVGSLWARGLSVHGDPWWDWTIGRWELRHHTLAMMNLWGSHALGRAWVNPEWLWSLILALAAHGGYAGWMLVLAIGMAGYFAGITVLSQQWHLRPTLRAFILLVGLICAEGGWGFRPQVWAYAAAIFALWFIQRIHRGMTQGDPATWKYGVGLLALTVGWAQFHGSWILVPLWCGLELALSPSWRRRGGWAALGMLSLGLVAYSQPWGWAYVTTAFHMTGNPAITQGIAEWASPNFHHAIVFALYAGYGIVGGWALWGRPQAHRGHRWRRTAYWLGFGCAACYAVRFVPYLPMGLLLAWADWDLGDIHLLSPKWATVMASVLTVGILVPMGVHLVDTHPALAQEAIEEPVGALAALAAHGYGPGTAVFADLGWGGYLEWRGYRPWVDGRENFWSQQGTTLPGYDAIISGAVNPGPALRRLGERIVILPPTSSLVWGLHAEGWARVWRGANAIVEIAPGTLWSRPATPTLPLIPSVFPI